VYAVVLAGGGGTRLWPLSTPERPKPFLRLIGDETLIQRSVARLSPLVAPADVYVVTDQRYCDLVHEQLPGIPQANFLGSRSAATPPRPWLWPPRRSIVPPTK